MQACLHNAGPLAAEKEYRRLLVEDGVETTAKMLIDDSQGYSKEDRE